MIKTGTMQTTKQLNKLYLWAALAILFTLITIFSFAQTRQQAPVRVKVVKIVDGDTTTIEKNLEEAKVDDFTKQFQNIKGKNVQVMITVEDGDKNSRANKSPSSMQFNFDMDSSMANAFGRAFMFSDSAFSKKFVWNDSLLKGIPRDFNFNFNFDEDKLMKDFDFDFNIDTEDDGKTVIIRKNGGNSIVISGDDDDVTISNSDSDKSKSKTSTKTIVIEDEKGKAKKKVIVSTSVVVIDLDDEKEAGKTDRKKAREEESFKFYPNPSDGNFVLDLDLNGKDDASVRIMDMNGKEVYSEKFSGNDKTSKTISLGAEKKGTFIVTIKQGKRTSSKKIIIE